jgi:MoaA/NifB/PqqE/SkfB family radical SAM enzyme
MVVYHIDKENWLKTNNGDSRGYIQSDKLKELWIHTGTNCNLGCPFCYENSSPGDNRIEEITFDEAQILLDEAKSMGVEKVSITGGEPFVNKHFIKILDYSLDLFPVLVLTNGTTPIRNKFEQLKKLISKPYPLKFRISLDCPDPKLHDIGRGAGSFEMAINSLTQLYGFGFDVSIARLMKKDEDTQTINNAYQGIFKSCGLPDSISIIAFPELYKPESNVDVPGITENCMTTYQDENSRKTFMCHYSRMALKKSGKIGIYACTLVDDDDDYNLGTSLAESLKPRIMLKHHRCFSCFSSGTSCSES